MKVIFSKLNYRLCLLLLWLSFTVSLTIWWFVFGQRQLELITLSGLSSTEELVKGQKMLLWEGLTLVASLVIGALAFFLLARKEKKESQAVQNFLMTYTHELKTPIASLRLQAQELKDRLANTKEHKLLERLVADTSRLTLQLDNSLFLASIDSESIVKQEILFSELAYELEEDWPGVKIEFNIDLVIKADKRILLSILRNIVHNAVAHAKASSVSFKLSANTDKNSVVTIAITDNGRDFSGELNNLGKLFKRHYPGSGSGIGLYLVNKLVAVLGGDCKYSLVDNKLMIELVLPLAMLPLAMLPPGMTNKSINSKVTDVNKVRDLENLVAASEQ